MVAKKNQFSPALLKLLNFNKMGGLIPAVIQENKTNEVLMIGFVNKESLSLTLKTRKMHYYSRKKQRTWLKGESSGYFQQIKHIYVNCDRSSLLFKVEQIGNGACDLGYSSCFEKEYVNNRLFSVGNRVFYPDKVYQSHFNSKLTLCLPVGSLQPIVFSLLDLAQIRFDKKSDRSYIITTPENSDLNIVMARSMEIPMILQNGKADIGITGSDLIEDSGIKLTDLGDLKFNKKGRGKVNLVLATPNNVVIKNISDFEDKIIATSYPNLVKNWFNKRGIKIKVLYSYGATEAKAPLLASAIVDLCETGKTLYENNLKPIASLFTTSVHLYANNDSYGYTWKRRKMEKIYQILKKAANKLPKNPKQLLNNFAEF